MFDHLEQSERLTADGRGPAERTDAETSLVIPRDAEGRFLPGGPRPGAGRPAGKGLQSLRRSLVDKLNAQAPSGRSVAEEIAQAVADRAMAGDHRHVEIIRRTTEGDILTQSVEVEIRYVNDWRDETSWGDMAEIVSP